MRIDEYTKQHKVKTIKVGEDAIGASQTHYALVRDRQVVAIGEKDEMLNLNQVEGGRVWVSTKQVGDLVESVMAGKDVFSKGAYDGRLVGRSINQHFKITDFVGGTFDSDCVYVFTLGGFLSNGIDVQGEFGYEYYLKTHEHEFHLIDCRPSGIINTNLSNNITAIMSHKVYADYDGPNALKSFVDKMCEIGNIFATT